jgi:alpha-L-rhamnosidase
MKGDLSAALIERGPCPRARHSKYVAVVRRVAGAGVAFALFFASSGGLGSMSVAAAADVAATQDRPPTAPTLLTVNDAAAPLAVEGAPQFGWVDHDPDRGEVQSAYELVVSEVPIAGGPAVPVWRSGKQGSTQQAYVTAPGLALQPDRSYVWTVRTWDRADRAGPFAPPAHFDVGILDGDWHADWIRRPGAELAAAEDFSLVRKQLTLTSSPVVRARAYVSAGQQYDLRVNGVRVAHGPSFSYPDEQYYQASDITRLLRAGTANVVGAVTHWSTPGQGRPASVPAFIARITVDHADGTRQVFTTDATWRTRLGPWIQGADRNSEGSFVEHIDGRLDPVGWDNVGFNDSRWPPARVVGPHPVAPFTHLYAARTAIVEHPVLPVTLSRLGNGAYVADFGAVIAATPAVALRRGVRDRAVSVLGGYLLDPNGHVSATHGIQETDMHWYYDERAGSQVFRPFGYLGFRYLEIDGAGETLTRADVLADARHVAMPDEHAASFATSNPAIDAVWKLAAHSALYSSQEQFIDTPTREQGAFMDPFDSAVTMAAFDDRAMTFEALRDFARSQKRYWPDGRVNVVYPNGDGKRDIPDSTEQYAQWVWRTYQTTGDLDQLASLYPVAKNIADYIDRAIDPKTGLVTNLPGGGNDYLYGLVDWPPQSRYGYDMATAARTTENILAVDVFRDVADMARALGRPAQETQTAGDRAARLTHVVNTRLRRADGVYVDGLEANGTASTHASQIANAYALALRVTPQSAINTVGNYVVSLGNEMGVSTFSNLLVGLHNAGRDDALVAAITDPKRPGYAQILKESATYTWESWNARQTGDSESHGFGSTVLTTLQDDILGVSVVTAGGARVNIQTPALTPMRAAGVVVTQRGRIPIAWDRPSPHHFSLAVTIPDNVIAEVHVPVTNVNQMTDGGHTITLGHGVIAVHTHPNEVVLVVGSGHYDLRAPAAAADSTFAWTIAILLGAIAATGIAFAMVVRRRRHAAPVKSASPA